VATTEVDLDEVQPPLPKMDCTRTDCAKDLHCFLPDRKMARRKQKGPCRSCGKELVDWSRLEKKDLTDVPHTIEMLKQEWIRHEYWCSKPVDSEAETRAHQSGLQKLRDEAETIIRKSVGPTMHPRQGRQTSWDGNIIFYGQHATASCCRRCIEVWHGISRKRDLTEDEMRYFTELICVYIRHRLPDVTDNGESGWTRSGE
jgi:Domain of unknown function (DUF4186)